MIKKIILLGKPGAGKGTLSQELEKQMPNLHHVSTGDIFRANIKNKTKLGLKIISILKNGDYVPDDVTNEVLKNAIANFHSFLLDGYPRTINQAQFLDSICKIDNVVLLDVTKDTIIKRLSSRFICETGKHIFNTIGNKPKVAGICDFDQTPLHKRKDDLPKAIVERLNIYDEKTLPLIEYYKKQGKLITLNANFNDHKKLAKDFIDLVINV
jgi:adenylate kinase